MTLDAPAYEFHDPFRYTFSPFVYSKGPGRGLEGRARLRDVDRLGDDVDDVPLVPKGDNKRGGKEEERRWMQINSWPRYNTGSLATLLSLFSSFLSFYSFLLTPHLDAHVREKGKGAPKSPERERERRPPWVSGKKPCGHSTAKSLWKAMRTDRTPPPPRPLIEANREKITQEPVLANNGPSFTWRWKQRTRVVINKIGSTRRTKQAEWLNDWKTGARLVEKVAAPTARAAARMQMSTDSRPFTEQHTACYTRYRRYNCLFFFCSQEIFFFSFLCALVIFWPRRWRREKTIGGVASECKRCERESKSAVRVQLVPKRDWRIQRNGASPCDRHALWRFRHARKQDGPSTLWRPTRLATDPPGIFIPNYSFCVIYLCVYIYSRIPFTAPSKSIRRWWWQRLSYPVGGQPQQHIINLFSYFLYQFDRLLFCIPLSKQRLSIIDLFFFYVTSSIEEWRTFVHKKRKGWRTFFFSRRWIKNRRDTWCTSVLGVAAGPSPL